MEVREGRSLGSKAFLIIYLQVQVQVQVQVR
jgi:hypothetical protein